MLIIVCGILFHSSFIQNVIKIRSKDSQNQTTQYTRKNYTHKNKIRSDGASNPRPHHTCANMRLVNAIIAGSLKSGHGEFTKLLLMK